MRDAMFFGICLYMNDGSWSCVKVLYSTCDSVLSAKWLIQIGTQVLKWSRLKSQFYQCKRGDDISTAASAVSSSSTAILYTAFDHYYSVVTLKNSHIEVVDLKLVRVYFVIGL